MLFDLKYMVYEEVSKYRARRTKEDTRRKSCVVQKNFLSDIAWDIKFQGLKIEQTWGDFVTFIVEELLDEHRRR